MVFLFDCLFQNKSLTPLYTLSSILPSFLPSFLPLFLPFFLPIFLPIFLACLLAIFLPIFLLSFLSSCLPSFHPSSYLVHSTLILQTLPRPRAIYLSISYPVHLPLFHHLIPSLFNSPFHSLSLFLYLSLSLSLSLSLTYSPSLSLFLSHTHTLRGVPNRGVSRVFPSRDRSTSP